MENKKAKYEMTSGYAGSFGLTWEPVDDETADEALSRAASFEKMDKDEMIKIMNDGRGCSAKTGKQSPNYYYDHGMEMIRSTYRKSEPVVEMVKCACGHTVPRKIVMSASLGSSCPNCYDKMSD